MSDTNVSLNANIKKYSENRALKVCWDSYHNQWFAYLVYETNEGTDQIILSASSPVDIASAIEALNAKVSKARVAEGTVVS